MHDEHVVHVLLVVHAMDVVVVVVYVVLSVYVFVDVDVIIDIVLLSFLHVLLRNQPRSYHHVIMRVVAMRQ